MSYECRVLLHQSDHCLNVRKPLSTLFLCPATRWFVSRIESALRLPRDPCVPVFHCCLRSWLSSFATSRWSPLACISILYRGICLHRRIGGGPDRDERSHNSRFQIGYSFPPFIHFLLAILFAVARMTQDVQSSIADDHWRRHKSTFYSLCIRRKEALLQNFSIS